MENQVQQGGQQGLAGQKTGVCKAMDRGLQGHGQGSARPRTGVSKAENGISRAEERE